MAKTGDLYDRWAALALQAGYSRVTSSTAHLWRRRGLLPAAIIHRAGFGGTRSELPAGAEPRILAICRYRYDKRVRDLSLIGTLLWLDGVEFELARLRKLLEDSTRFYERELRRQGSRARSIDPDDANADLDYLAAGAVRDGGIARLGHGERQDESASANAIVEYAAVVTGRKRADAIDPEAVAPLGLELGLASAMTDAPAGVKPWLEKGDVGEYVRDAAAHVDPVAIRSRLAALTDDELGVTRDLAVRLTSAVLPAADFATLVMSPGQFGLGTFRPDLLGSPLGRIHVFWLCVSMGHELEPALESFAAMADELGGLADLGRQWLAEHPEHASAAAELGLGKVIELSETPT